MMYSRSLSSVWLSALALAACGGSQPSAPPPTSPEPPPEEAVGDTVPGVAPHVTPEAAAPVAGGDKEKTVQIVFQPKSGSALVGSGTLSETGKGVTVSLALENVAPGEHGAHVHEKGDCSAPDGSSAGSHFNPGSSPHALPASAPRHLGDLGNIEIGSDGIGTIDVLAPGANLRPGDPTSFLGKAIIIHEKKDDGGQPTGNAGHPIGCAEIE
jgi:superoxide dismutase, Cu-Zn family